MIKIKRINEGGESTHKLPSNFNPNGWYWNTNCFYTARKCDKDGNIIEDNCRNTVLQARAVFKDMRLRPGETKYVLEVCKNGEVTELEKESFHQGPITW